MLEYLNKFVRNDVRSTRLNFKISTSFVNEVSPEILQIKD